MFWTFASLPAYWPDKKLVPDMRPKRMSQETNACKRFRMAKVVSRRQGNE